MRDFFHSSQNQKKQNCSIAGHSLYILILTSLLTGYQAAAQLSAIHDFKRAVGVQLLSENNDTLLYPFAGGLNNCQFTNMDINLDGIDDLLVFDRHGNRILPFIVLPEAPLKYLFAPEYSMLFPPVEQWIEAVDYNNDGKKDIFTYTTGGIKVYRNDSESALKFTKVTNPFILSQQGATLTNILVTYADYPAITDIDNDGDYDILTFWGLGSFLEWHKNTSIEKYGISDSLTFEKVSSCWGHFAEGSEDNKIKLDTCAPTGAFKMTCDEGIDDPKHTGSTVLTHDLNADGLPDLTIGDVDFSTVVHLTNGGTLSDARMISQTTAFPNATNPVNMNSFPAAMLADVNNDGQTDLLISPFDPSLTKGENFRSTSLYLNSGTTANPVYNFVSESFLQNQMLDLGSGAYPVFVDFNGDGKLDLLVGDYGYTDTCIYTPVNGLQCTYTAKVALLINEGTDEIPVFRLAERNIAHLDTLHMQSLIPAVADMDGDGDADLVCGNSKGKFVYCENVALPGQPADFKLADPAWQGIDIGDFSAPQLFDMDQDGLTDLICGKRNGTLSFYKNTGTPEQASFTLITDNFGGVDITNTQLSIYGYSVPCFYAGKMGETVLFLGSEFGEIFVYDNISNNLNGNFRFRGTIPGINEGWRSGVAIGNLNNDTLSDMIIGNYSGGLGIFYGIPDKIFGINEQTVLQFSALRIMPNPACDEISIYINENQPVSSGYVAIHGIDGSLIMKPSEVEFPAKLDISKFRNGIYLVSVQTFQGIATGKLVICR